ncbi:MAG: hypothetical protein ACFFDK_11235 [Promethearchaeota archaeon]
MKKKEKKSAKKTKDLEEAKDAQQVERMSKLDVMLEIDKLKSNQDLNIAEGNNEKAIKLANQIIELAIRYNMMYCIKEQEDTLQLIAKKEQKKFFKTEIEKECLILNEKYDILVESNEIVQAHEQIESFKEKYRDTPGFDKLSLVKSLLEKDQRAWINYLATSQNK